jgi:hypothetical protein
MIFVYVAIVIIALVLGTLRVLGHKSQAFQAIAHLFVGGLFGAWMAGHNTVFITVAVLLSIVELLCFLFLKKEITNG